MGKRNGPAPPELLGERDGRETEKPSAPDLRIEAEACYQDYISGKATLNEVREKQGLPRLNFPGTDDWVMLISAEDQRQTCERERDPEPGIPYRYLGEIQMNFLFTKAAVALGFVSLVISLTILLTR